MAKKKEKKAKTPTYQVTIEQIRAYVQQGYIQGRDEAIKKATDFSMAVPIIVLRDEFGFGAKRLEKFIDATHELYDSIDQKYLNLDDIVKTIKEETGVEIIRRNTWKG